MGSIRRNGEPIPIIDRNFPSQESFDVDVTKILALFRVMDHDFAVPPIFGNNATVTTECGGGYLVLTSEPGKELGCFGFPSAKKIFRYIGFDRHEALAIRCKR